MYLEPPTENITLVEFEELALNRLRVLQLVEQTKERLAQDIDEIYDALAKVVSFNKFYYTLVIEP